MPSLDLNDNPLLNGTALFYNSFICFLKNGACLVPSTLTII